MKNVFSCVYVVEHELLLNRIFVNQVMLNMLGEFGI